MRPETLFPLFRSVSALKGVGPAMQAHLRRLVGEALYVRDLLFHTPSGYTDRRQLHTLLDAPREGVATLCVRIDKHYAPGHARARRSPYRMACSDDSASGMLVFFGYGPDTVKKLLPEGETRIVSGKLELYDGLLQMVNPELIAKPEEKESALTLEANYPLTQGLTQKKMRALMAQALAECPELDEWLLDSLRSSKEWAGFKDSLTRLHRPKELEDGLPESPFRARLAYDELLANQLSLAVVRERSVKQQGILIEGESPLQTQLLSALPFELTAGQRQVMQEIAQDYASGNRMLRLLQGDVGSGKTIVALLAMLPLLERGYQAALMVPTEILGKQHVASLRELTEPLGLSVALLSGKLPAAERRALQAQIEAGEVDIIVGTHALFQSSVTFKQLGLVVIDEQHRFGVKQRLALTSKGQKPHILLMTATPIPRSLTMTAYGDMDSSLLPDKPIGRLPIDTRAVPLTRLHEVAEGLKRALAGGTKAYWICPLVEESEDDMPRPEGDLAAAEERYRVFKNLFGPRVALVHGRMKPDEREEAMQGFAGDTYDLLVATTVVEVGVNVPEATIMVIEHAERFGLAQLHQLRGRVGRGAAQSNCILLYANKLSEVGQERLKIIRETNDGFKIAEEDLLLRGAGDVLGTRQSGLPDFHFADLVAHRELMRTARDNVKYILHTDPTLESKRGKALRSLLYLFGYDESLQFIKAG
jgi:ATP-dependent DNA helicase RecG